MVALQVDQFHKLADDYSEMYGKNDWKAPSPPAVPLEGAAAAYPRRVALASIDEFGVRKYT